jgi:hypothetical protein
MHPGPRGRSEHTRGAEQDGAGRVSAVVCRDSAAALAPPEGARPFTSLVAAALVARSRWRKSYSAIGPGIIRRARRTMSTVISRMNVTVAVRDSGSTRYPQSDARAHSAHQQQTAGDIADGSPRKEAMQEYSTPAR